MRIDGVFSGGGIKGFALVGAYEEIERRKLSFVRLAGTSAGAIMAAFIAAGYTSAELKKLMFEVDGKQLLDDVYLDIPLVRWLKIYYKLGMYKGKKLEQWLEDRLAAKGIRTFGDLAPESLRVITSDITNGRLLTLPDDLPSYNKDPLSFSVARAVRMSCTLPYFFQPVKINAKSLVVDGGVLSNFPIWLFDEEDKKKKRPVLGVKLITKTKGLPRQVKTGTDLFGALFHTMKDAHDARYISRRHEKNIIFIPVSGTSVTDFNLTDEKKHALIQTGRDYAKAFFKSWCY
ncbi:patatin-like phospholipase family protein [Bacillus xiapuensis]|uniref:patatin-like phospholipase family protein n=1 Tax=Bacillus xiapuensis TaxID=2014075 RepID=UPI000C24FFE4|nr:patatin-like phospholipase family protein [Bacillus xiapuensis]